MNDRGEPVRKQRRLTDLWRGAIFAETDIESPGAATCSQAISSSSTVETAGTCAAAVACKINK